MTIAIIAGIGTSASSGMAAACINNSNSLPSPPSTNQLLTKSRSLSNDTDNRDTSNCITTPNKPQLTNTLQKSPSDSLSSKNDTEKSRSTKSRNKEGTTLAQFKPNSLPIVNHFASNCIEKPTGLALNISILIKKICDISRRF